MLYTLICVLILSILGTGAYYAAYQWINLRHNRDTIADELQRATAHIEDLEARIVMLEADKQLSEFKAKPAEDTTGWSAFDARG